MNLLLRDASFSLRRSVVHNTNYGPTWLSATLLAAISRQILNEHDFCFLPSGEPRRSNYFRPNVRLPAVGKSYSRWDIISYVFLRYARVSSFPISYFIAKNWRNIMRRTRVSKNTFFVIFTTKQTKLRWDIFKDLFCDEATCTLAKRSPYILNHSWK